MDSAALLGIFEQVYPYIYASSLGMARMLAMMSVMPAFIRMGITAPQRSGIALVLSLPIMPMTLAVVMAEPLTFGRFGILIGKEAMIGFIIGVVLGIPIWAAEAAGDIVDLQRGSTLANLIDPSSVTESSVTGTLFAIALVALFFATGGLSLVLRTVYESYGIWPIGSTAPMLGADTGRIVLSLLDDIMSMGLMLAIPIVLAMLLADFCLALIARAAPHLHVFDLSLSLKSLVFCLMLVLYGSFMLNYMEYDLRWLLSAKERLEMLKGP